MIKTIKKICYKAIINKIRNISKYVNINDIEIYRTKNLNIGHFQLNSCMKISKIINISSMEIATHIKIYLENNSNKIFKKIEIKEPGFINFKITKKFIFTKIKELKVKIIKKKKNNKTVIIDYSSPNIAKEMHIGHLRSTIIGEFIAKILEYKGYNVVKINHLGDWGTQFGMLIKYIKNKYNSDEKKIKKLNTKKLIKIYKKSQKKFESNKKFKKLAKEEVILLQNEDKKSLKIWRILNETSKKEYKKIYNKLNIKNLINMGESFYRNYLEKIINKINTKNLICISNGAKCIKIQKNQDLLYCIVQKSDGGFNYTTTDLAALYFRIKKQKADWIIYVTDIGQTLHFETLFEIANKAALKNKTKLTHIPFGLILKEDGKKIKTREGNYEKLSDLIKISIKEAKKIIKLKRKNLNNNLINKLAKKLGINAIKYSDLSGDIKQSYKFKIKDMLKFSGNTSAFLTYAYVRINSIEKKVNKIKTIINNEKKYKLKKTELDLCLHLIQFPYIIEQIVEKLNPNILTKYLYEVAEKFHKFFHKCKVINSKYQKKRLIICNLTKIIIKRGLNLLGLEIINKM